MPAMRAMRQDHFTEGSERETGGERQAILRRSTASP
jgi:hypothetical protein